MEPPRASGRARWALAAAGALAAVFLAGAALDLGPFVEEETSRAELVAGADQICQAAHEAYADLQATPPRTPGEATELTANLVGISEDELDRLRELDAPPELGTQFDTYLEARSEGIELLRRGLEAAEARDAAAYSEAQAELGRTQPERIELARAIGFAECSRPIAPLQERPERRRGARR